MKKLDWDSNFWGIDFYSFTMDEMIEINLESKCLYQILLNQSDLRSKFKNQNLEYIETKITLVKEEFHLREINSGCFRRIEITDLDEHKNEFYDLFGVNSRYRIFPKDKVNEFYYTWMINSIINQSEVNAIGYFINNKLAGFVTFSLCDDFIQIGLIGVFKEFQRKGLSSQLIQYVENQIVGINISKIRISTNSFNLPALSTYIKNGFIIEDIKYWFYMYNI